VQHMLPLDMRRLILKNILYTAFVMRSSKHGRCGHSNLRMTHRDMERRRIAGVSAAQHKHLASVPRIS